MSTTNQWMNFAEIEMIVAQRVANAIETIAIYKTKTRMDRDSTDRVEHQKDKVAKDASDKSKWEGNLGRNSSQQQNKRHKCNNYKRIGHQTRNYLVMSDSEDSTVTYMEAPPSPDYLPGLEKPERAPPSPEFVPEPVYPEFMPPEDEEDEEDPEEDPADYPADGGDNDDDDDESSDDDEDDDDDVEEDEDKEEEEHLAPADSVPPPVDRLLAIPTPPPSPLSPLSSPLPQILSPLPQILSPPLPVSPPPLPASPTYLLGYRATMIRLRAESPSTSHPLPLPSPIILPYTRASVAMMRAAAPSTHILASRSETPPSGTPPFLPIPLPTLSLPLLLPSTDCRAGVSEVMLLPRKRLCIALGLRFKVGESSSAPTARPTRGFRVDYGFVSTLDDKIRQDTYEIYGRLDDAQDDRLLMSGHLNMLRRDRCAHARTARLMDTEAILSHEAWVQSMDASVTTCSKKMAPKRTTRSTPATTTTPTTSVIDEQLTRLIDQGVGDALATRDADRS
ncbi:hypothetical protein Tco_0682518 [Tanacetum coccineum]|uniref:Uncharacterized protein n=1 Tax=Tanacetum coccineum TaxID=301880 RepID=A0ABQ4XT97_9ASTR